MGKSTKDGFTVEDLDLVPTDQEEGDEDPSPEWRWWVDVHVVHCTNPFVREQMDGPLFHP